MLVVSRKLNEVVCIGDDIRVTVVEIERGRIRLGFEAPDGVIILREELIAQREANQEGDLGGGS